MKKQRKEEALTDLKDDDEGQPGGQDVPELQGELVGLRAPGRSPVVPVPAESGLVGRAHLKHRQAAVHVASQTPGEHRERERVRPPLKPRPENKPSGPTDAYSSSWFSTHGPYLKA